MSVTKSTSIFPELTLQNLSRKTSIALLTLVPIHAFAILPSINAQAQTTSFQQYNPNQLNGYTTVATSSNIPVQGNSLPSNTAAPSVTTTNSSTYVTQSNAYSPTQSATPAVVPTNTVSHTSKISQEIIAKIIKTDPATGQQTSLPVDSSTVINSGDVIEYEGRFTNNSVDRVSSMNVTLTIPESVTFEGSVSPNTALGSADGIKFIYMPLKATINGVLQELPFSYYQALRWEVTELPANQTAVVKYRATVK